MLAISEAVCRYRALAGHRRAAVPRPRHAPAVGAGLPLDPRGAGRPRRGRDDRRRRRLHAHARDLARDPHPQPRRREADGGRDRRHAVAQPARGRRLQVQPAPRRAGRHRGHVVDRERGERAARRGARGGQARPVRAGGRRARRCTATTTSPPTWTTCPPSWTSTRSASSGLRLGVDPLGGVERRLLGSRGRAPRPRPDDRERRARSRPSRSCPSTGTAGSAWTAPRRTRWRASPT